MRVEGFTCLKGITSPFLALINSKNPSSSKVFTPSFLICSNFFGPASVPRTT